MRLFMKPMTAHLISSLGLNPCGMLESKDYRMRGLRAWRLFFGANGMIFQKFCLYLQLKIKLDDYEDFS